MFVNTFSIIFVLTKGKWFSFIKLKDMRNTIEKNTIEVKPNYSKRTFTIRKNGLKYRTIPLSKEEFNSCLKNTENDWVQFLKSDDYYTVKN